MSQSEVTNWFEDPAELRKRRRGLGLTQSELAKKVHRSRSLVRDVEQGRVKLRGSLAQELWAAIAHIDVKRRLENVGFQGFSVGQETLRALEADPTPSDFIRLNALLSLREKAHKVAPIRALSGEVAALHQELARSSAVITMQGVLLSNYRELADQAQERIDELKAEVAGLRSELVADIQRLEEELSRKLELAAKEGANILRANVSEVPISEPTK